MNREQTAGRGHNWRARNTTRGADLSHVNGTDEHDQGGVETPLAGRTPTPDSKHDWGGICMTAVIVENSKVCVEQVQSTLRFLVVCSGRCPRSEI